jgi:hypothetical protein
MGTLAVKTPSFRQVSLACWALLAALSAGCSSGGGDGVASGLFVAPLSETPDVGVLADKLDFLRAIRPTLLDSELALIPVDSFVVGHLSASRWIRKQELNQNNQLVWSMVPDPEGGPYPKGVDELLTYEAKSGSLLSVNLCRDASDTDCGKVRLNYNARGIDAEESRQGARTQGGVISKDVAPIQLKNGWILSYDSGGKNIVAFRKELPGKVEYADGSTGFADYRPHEIVQGTANKNFGSGNRLVLSLVVSGEDMMDQLDAASEPIVTRFVEIEPNKVLVFFRTIRAVHLLELFETEEVVDFNLDDNVTDSSSYFPIRLLRGEFKLFGTQPFITYRTIAENLTGDANIVFETFQPIIVPSDGAALVFDQSSSMFIKLLSVKAEIKDPDTGETTVQIIGGRAEEAIVPSSVYTELQEGSGGNLVDPPLNFTGAYYHPKHPWILLFEDKTNNLLSYKYEETTDNVGLFVNSTKVLQRRQPDGTIGSSFDVEPSLIFAVGDVRDNRMAFDSGLDELVSFNYTAGVCVVAATKTSITDKTFNLLANINYVEPLDTKNVRAFDNQSNSLLALFVNYLTMPITVSGQGQ